MVVEVVSSFWFRVQIKCYLNIAIDGPTWYRRQGMRSSLLAYHRVQNSTQIAYTYNRISNVFFTVSQPFTGASYIVSYLYRYCVEFALAETVITVITSAPDLKLSYFERYDRSYRRANIGPSDCNGKYKYLTSIFARRCYI